MKKVLLSIIITSFILLSGMNVLLAQPIEGFKLNVSYPLIAGSYFDDQTGPSIGIAVDTPYGFDLGPYAVGVGGGIEMANIGADENYSYTGIYLSLESTVYELSSGSPVSVYGGVGFYGGLAGTGALMFDYEVSSRQPIVIQPYVGGTVFLDSNGEGGKSYIMSIGAMINYSF